jgi:hypothetical protein
MYPSHLLDPLSPHADERALPPVAAQVASAEPLHVVYLGVSGVLHPSATLYRLVHGSSPWSDGHRKYEAAFVLEQAMAPWPDARIVLTSTQPWSKGLDQVLEQLGPGLAARVIGFTYEDLTLHAAVPPRHKPIDSDDYWRLMKCDIVRRHLEWLRPAAWIAIDDESSLWNADERRGHLVTTNGCLGLMEPAAQDRLTTVLLGNFELGQDAQD